MTAGTRRKSRELAMQMLFQADIGKQNPEQLAGGSRLTIHYDLACNLIGQASGVGLHQLSTRDDLVSFAPRARNKEPFIFGAGHAPGEREHIARLVVNHGADACFMGNLTSLTHLVIWQFGELPLAIGENDVTHRAPHGATMPRHRG